MSEPAVASFSTISPGAMIDPFPAYDALRLHDPVHWSKEDGAWVLSRYADVAAVISDPSFKVIELASIVGHLGRLAGKDTADLQSVLEAILFFRNPPQHGDERRFTVAVLAATPLSSLIPTIEALVERLLAPLRDTGEMDAVRELADRLPPMVLGRLIGVPDDVVLGLMDTIADVSMSFDRGRSMRFYERVNRSVAIGRKVFLEAIADHRRHPRDDGLSRMIALSDTQYHLDDGVIASRALFLLAVGVETTSSLIGNAIHAVLGHPAAARQVHANPDAAEGAVEEAVRFDSPVQQVTRVATLDRTIGDRQIKAGDRMVLLIGAANRDPAAFADPGRFDIDRRDRSHLGFGAGTHFCVGASLARIETRIALRRLMELDPVAAPNQTEERWAHRTIRRLRSYKIATRRTPA